jgi:hypothetical protein
MGWFSADKPKARHVEKTVSTSSLRYGHSPDKRGKRRDRYANQPLDVDRSGKVIDGNDRLYYAKQRGQRTIRVRVWD